MFLTILWSRWGGSSSKGAQEAIPRVGWPVGNLLPCLSSQRLLLCKSVFSPILLLGCLVGWNQWESYLPTSTHIKGSEMLLLTTSLISLSPGQHFIYMKWAGAMWVAPPGCSIPGAPSLTQTRPLSPLESWNVDVGLCLRSNGLPFFLLFPPVCLCSTTAVTPTARLCSMVLTSCCVRSVTLRRERR